MYLDKQHPKPVYLQLKELLQNQIEQGVYVCHQQLPSERYLCQHHSLSRMTVRRALQALIAEGFAYTQAGKGTFVNQKSSVNGRVQVNKVNQNKKADLSDVPIIVGYKQQLMTLLQSFDCVGAERVIREALAVHSLETVAGKLFFDTIRGFEKQWHKGEVSLLVHNHATTMLRSQLIAMMNAAVMPNAGSKILLACAPGDQHEIGLLLLALSLRRRGFLVVYLGQNLYADDLYYVIDSVQPRLVCLSAATDQSVKNLLQLSRQYQDKLILEKGFARTGNGQKPHLAFGGTAFNRNPQAVSDMPGYFLGNTVEEAVLSIQSMFT